MRLDVGANVSPQFELLIRHGLAGAGDHIETSLGGDIPADVRSNITVKIVATGQGNPEEGAKGAAFTAFSRSATPPGGPRPFFDVGWFGNGPTYPQIEKIVAHEYAHVWQSHLGCIDMFSQPLGDWINEGIAEQVAFDVMIAGGAYTRADVDAFMLGHVTDTDGWSYRLADMSTPGETPVWAGNIGYVALEFAMASTSRDLTALQDICSAVAGGASQEEAFEVAFGVGLDAFYQSFEDWKASQV